MAIYDIFDVEKQVPPQSEASEPFNEEERQSESSIPHSSFCKDRFFSSLTARLFFLVLLAADLLWALYSALLFALSLFLNLTTAFKRPGLLDWMARRWLSVRRSLICGVSLFVTLFSPSFGILIACTYFLMYDKSGIEEVVPSSLQAQFKEFFKAQ